MYSLGDKGVVFLFIYFVDVNAMLYKDHLVYKFGVKTLKALNALKALTLQRFGGGSRPTSVEIFIISKITFR